MRLIIEVKNPTEVLTGHILFTLVVGYFADAQYDVLFIPYRRRCRHFACAQYDMFFYLSLRGSIATAAISQEGDFPRIYFVV